MNKKYWIVFAFLLSLSTLATDTKAADSLKPADAKFELVKLKAGDQIEASVQLTSLTKKLRVQSDDGLQLHIELGSGCRLLLKSKASNAKKEEISLGDTVELEKRLFTLSEALISKTSEDPPKATSIEVALSDSKNIFDKLACKAEEKSSFVTAADLIKVFDELGMNLKIKAKAATVHFLNEEPKPASENIGPKIHCSKMAGAC